MSISPSLSQISNIIKTYEKQQNVLKRNRSAHNMKLGELYTDKVDISTKSFSNQVSSPALVYTKQEIMAKRSNS